MTRTLTFLVLGCLLLTGVAVASILGRDSVPMLSSSDVAQSTVPVSRGPVANREGKKDRLPAAMMASLAPADAGPAADQLRQAFATEGTVDLPQNATALPPIVVPQPNPRAKAAAAKNAGHKNYTLLSDAQIAAIKGRLNLTASQEPHWPDIEIALRAIARKMHDSKPAAGNAPPIDPDSTEVQQLKAAAMPLLFKLREDQKREVRALARIIGLEKVAAAI
ncbi:hypothetical protein [Tardiphaga sp.]|uniref:hypothetical protein n=1 Tax=Tardiphaga sp. TaxID=1926292 RepID=UPI0037D99783